MQSPPDQWCSGRICTNVEHPRVNKGQSSAFLSATAAGKPQRSSLSIPSPTSKNFQNLQQWPNSAALEAKARTSDICLGALENLICCWSCCRPALCNSQLHPLALSLPEEKLGCTAALGLDYPAWLRATISDAQQQEESRINTLSILNLQVSAEAIRHWYSTTDKFSG